MYFSALQGIWYLARYLRRIVLIYWNLHHAEVWTHA